MYNDSRDYLANLLKHTSGHDYFMWYMVQINSSALEKYILSVNGNNKLTHEEMMCVKKYCFDLRLYPVGEKTFGISDDDFELVFSDQCLTLDGLVCKKL